MVNKLLSIISEWIFKAQQREVEFYLSQSTDIVDLERRIRNLDKKAW